MEPRMEPRMVNLTPHAIGIQTPSGAVVTIPPSGTIARVASTPGAPSTPVTVDGHAVPVTHMPVWGSVEGLPDPVEGAAYVVSQLVLSRLQPGSRPDVIAPATGPNDGVIRDKEGRVAAVTRFLTA